MLILKNFELKIFLAKFGEVRQIYTTHHLSPTHLTHIQTHTHTHKQRGAARRVKKFKSINCGWLILFLVFVNIESTEKPVSFLF